MQLQNKNKNKFLNSFLYGFLRISLLIVFQSIVITSWVSGQELNLLKDVIEGSENKRPGVYFYRLEPSFYTGFAPRCQDARRIRTYLGRGNQVRVTLVLSDHIIDEYLSDLAIRYHIYRELIDTDRITLTQNIAFETFEDVILKEKILDLSKQRSTMNQEAFKKISLEKLQKLNPGKIFHITIDFKKRIKDWSSQLKGFQKRKLMVKDNFLHLLNEMLPTRLKITELSPDVKRKVVNVIKAYEQYEAENQQQAAWNHFYQKAVDLFITVTDGIYTFRDNHLDFYEFTAIYPVGTLNQFAEFDGIKIPLYPCPGKRVLHTHQRTKVVDHVPEVACYSYLPWIPYMHVGKRLHNSFHSLWFYIDTRKNRFIPQAWRQNFAGSRTGEFYPNLWLVSRGPMSHGCTHVNAGHISELRQLFPSSESELRKVVTFRSKSNHFDVFDINVDGTPEVMGVKYFYAYSLKNKKPYKLRTGTDRKSFYAWLYKKGYHYDEQDRLVFEQVTASKFVGKKPLKGKTYKNIRLYEAEYFPETIQFYRLKDIDFVKELRRVSSTYDFNRKVLQLPQK